MTSRKTARPAAVAVLVCALAGCQGRWPVGGSAPASPVRPPSARVAVVDFGRAARAHPRWPELEELDRRIADLQAQLAAGASGRFQPPQLDLAPELRAAAEREVEQLRPEFQREVQQQTTALQDAARRELDAYAAKLHADQQAQFDAKRAQLEGEGRKALEDKQQAIAKDNDQFQQRTYEQYRLQLLNLRLKLEAVQQTSKPESEKLSARIEALLKERDDTVTAHEKANAQVLEEFQQQQNEQFKAAITALTQQLTKEGQTLLDQKAAEITSRLKTQVTAKQLEINTQITTRLRNQIKARQEALVSSARAQMERAQGQAQGELRARVAAQQAQLQAAGEQRARLLATILADLRVEAAALGQQQGYQVILTQALATSGAVDVTDDLIARIKR